LETELDAAAAIVANAVAGELPSGGISAVTRFYHRLNHQKKSYERAVNAAQERLQAALTNCWRARKGDGSGGEISGDPKADFISASGKSMTKKFSIS